MKNMMCLWIFLEAAIHSLGFESQFWHVLCNLYMELCFPILDWRFNESLHGRCLSQELSTVHMECSVKSKWLRFSDYFPGAMHSSIPGSARLIFAKSSLSYVLSSASFYRCAHKSTGRRVPVPKTLQLVSWDPSTWHRAWALNRYRLSDDNKWR